MDLRRLAPLALALALACTGDSTATTGASDGEATSSSSSSSSTGAETETTSPTDPSTSTTSTSTSTSSTSTSGDATDSDTEGTGGTTGDSTTTGDLPDLCVDLCAKAETCAGAPIPECLGECAELDGIFHAIGPVCGAAIDAYLTCANGLGCLDLGALFDGQSTPCDPEAAAIEGEPPACILEEETPAFCADFCDKTEMCMIAEPGCLDECKVNYLLGDAFSPACGVALEAYLTCLADLTCPQLMNPVTCLDEATEVEALCDF